MTSAGGKPYAPLSGDQQVSTTLPTPGSDVDAVPSALDHTRPPAVAADPPSDEQGVSQSANNEPPKSTVVNVYYRSNKHWLSPPQAAYDAGGQTDIALCTFIAWERFEYDIDLQEVRGRALRFYSFCVHNCKVLPALNYCRFLVDASSEQLLVLHVCASFKCATSLISDLPIFSRLARGGFVIVGQWGWKWGKKRHYADGWPRARRLG